MNLLNVINYFFENQDKKDISDYCAIAVKHLEKKDIFLKVMVSFFEGIVSISSYEADTFTKDSGYERSFKARHFVSGESFKEINHYFMETYGENIQFVMHQPFTNRVEDSNIEFFIFINLKGLLPCPQAMKKGLLELAEFRNTAITELFKINNQLELL